MSETRLARATELARQAHAGQTDQQGEPYSAHVERVAAAVPAEAQLAAIFHDALEDTELKVADLAPLLTSDELAAWSRTVHLAFRISLATPTPRPDAVSTTGSTTAPREDQQAPLTECAFFKRFERWSYLIP